MSVGAAAFLRLAGDAAYALAEVLYYLADFGVAIGDPELSPICLVVVALFVGKGRFLTAVFALLAFVLFELGTRAAVSGENRS